MIKFFRRIRKQLLSERKFSNYLLYAVGEIVLVIIGILIALAISDWNSSRLEKVSEMQTLAELRKGLMMDLEVIQQEQKKINQAIVKIDRLQQLMLDQDQSYFPSLDSLFGAVYGVRSLRLNAAFYEDLKVAGLSSIKDDKIRLQIVQLFENNYQFIAGLQNNETSINQVNRPYYLTHFHSISFYQSATPNDFKTVWNDTYYHNIVDYRLITLQTNQVQQYALIIPFIEELIVAIEDYRNSND